VVYPLDEVPAPTSETVPVGPARLGELVGWAGADDVLGVGAEGAT
jgi:hypothetical protein